MVAPLSHWVACEVDERLVAEGPRMQVVVNACVERFGPVHRRRALNTGGYVYDFGYVREGVTTDVIVAPRWIAVQHGYDDVADTGWRDCEAGCAKRVRAVEAEDGGAQIVDQEGSTECQPTPGGARRVHR